MKYQNQVAVLLLRQYNNKQWMLAIQNSHIGKRVT